MRLVLRVLGLDLLDLEVTTPQVVEVDEGELVGECTTTPIGFSPSPGDQRWESGVDA